MIIKYSDEPLTIVDNAGLIFEKTDDNDNLLSGAEISLSVGTYSTETTTKTNSDGVEETSIVGFSDDLTVIDENVMNGASQVAVDVLDWAKYEIPSGHSGTQINNVY